jgi:hypothetical protein
MDDGVIAPGVAMVASCFGVWGVVEWSARERECRVPGPIIDGWAVRGPWKTRTDHFAPLVHAPKKTISDGWAVRGPWKRWTDHFAPLVHAPKKTISDGWAVRGLWKRWTDHFAPLVHAPKKTISFLC